MLFKRIFAGSVLSAFTLFANMFVAMAILPFIIKMLGNHDYGLWVFMVSFVGYYGLLDFGMSNAVTKFISQADGQKDIHEMNVILSSSTTCFFILGFSIFILSCIGALLTPMIANNDIITIQILWLTVGVTSIFQFGMRGVYGLYYAKIRQDVLSYTGITKLIIRTGLIIYYLKTGHGVVSLAIITMIMELLSYAAEAYIVKKLHPEMKFSFKLVRKSKIKTLFNYGIFSMINQISNLMRIRILPVIIMATASITYIVYFNIAMRLMELYEELIARIIGTMVPVISRYDGANNIEGIEKVFWMTFRINIALSTLIAGGLIVFSDSFIEWWIGENYGLASELTVWFTIGFFTLTVQETSRILLFGIAKHKIFSVISMVESIMGAGLGAILGFLYGPIWIAVGIISSMILFEIFIKPIVVSKIAKISIVRFYAVLLEVLGKVGTPIAIYGYVLSNEWISQSIVNIIISAIGLGIISLPFIWLSMNAETKTLIRSKLAILRKKRVSYV